MLRRFFEGRCPELLLSQERHYRDCLGRFATGVTVMTCREPDGAPTGITVNSFTSVSLEPKLILWNIARESRSTSAFLGAGEFVVNILGANQQAISDHFAQPERPMFDDLRATESETGQPVLRDCLAWLHCRTDAIHEGGDHYIIVGEVSRFELGDSTDPLLYFGSRYRTLNTS
jgi:flavin reductase (DIM6/NTAB) family NADH-FMN oxidoreductase RutF